MQKEQEQTHEVTDLLVLLLLSSCLAALSVDKLLLTWLCRDMHTLGRRLLFLGLLLLLLLLMFLLLLLLLLMFLLLLLLLLMFLLMFLLLLMFQLLLSHLLTSYRAQPPADWAKQTVSGSRQMCRHDELSPPSPRNSRRTSTGQDEGVVVEVEVVLLLVEEEATSLLPAQRMERSVHEVWSGEKTEVGKVITTLKVMETSKIFFMGYQINSNVTSDPLPKIPNHLNYLIRDCLYASIIL